MKIRRTDEGSVYAIDGDNLFEIVECGLCLDLNQNADLFVRALRVILMRPKPLARVVPATPRRPSTG